MWTALIAVVFAYSLVFITSNPLNMHADVALHIEAAEKILRGGYAGVDAVDTNPPLIMLITAVPTAVAHALGAHPVPTVFLFVWLFTVTTTFASRLLLANTLSVREALHADLLALGLAVASVSTHFSHQYGQREYFFIFGVMPYLMVRFRRWEGMAVRPVAAIGWGFLAGVATSIKPQFMLVVLAPEIYWLCTRRISRPLLKPEIYAAVSAAVLYLAYLTLIPEVREFFFGRWMPLMVQGYPAYNMIYGAMLVTHIDAWRPVVLAFLPFVLRGRPTDHAWRLMRPLATALAMAAAVYFLQHKGWPYQALPINVLASALAGLLVAQLLTRAPDAMAAPPYTGVLPQRLWVAALGSLAAIAITGSLLALGPSTRSAESTIPDYYTMARGIVEKTQVGDSVLILSTRVNDAYPLLPQIRRHHASRTMYAFPVALLYYGVESQPGEPVPYRGVDGREMLAEEQRYRADLLEDVHKVRPKLILVDMQKGCPACPEQFTLSDYFVQTGFFSALPQYSHSGQLDRFAMYELRD